MIPSTEQVIRYRFVVRIVFHVAGVLLLLGGIVRTAEWLLEGIVDTDLYLVGYYAGRACSSVLLMIVGAILALAAKPLAKLLVPLSPPVCPQCGYSLLNLYTSNCPECGLRLPHELIAEAAPAARPNTQAPVEPPPIVRQDRSASDQSTPPSESV